MMPHHHLIAGPISEDQEVSCYGDSFDIRRYRKRFDSCGCLSHSLARPWKEVTVDTEIVHTVAVLGARGAGGYMGKYFLKTFGMEGRLKAVGMKRRWSTSREWPGTGRLRLKQSLGAGGSGWHDVRYRRGYMSREEECVEGTLMERDGDVLRLALDARREKESKVKGIRRYLHD